MAISGALDALIHRRRDLSEEESEEAMDAILNGQATEPQMAAFLVALHLKGETAAEITGAARAMRRAAGTQNYAPLQNGPIVDTCGTGGDHSGTFNISTVAAFVVAGAGIPVAKHGNRSLSSACGSADLLESLGVNLARASTSLTSAGIAFFFAPLFHGATRHVQPVRAQLKMRTIFNYLGPLTNPAGANVQIAGAFSKHAASLIAKALVSLGLQRGFVVHGSDGLDEVTITAATHAFKLIDGEVQELTFEPETFGVTRAEPHSIQGGDISRNREIALAILGGEHGPARDVVVANAALAIHAAHPELTIQCAAELAGRSLTLGDAMKKLQVLQKL